MRNFCLITLVNGRLLKHNKNKTTKRSYYMIMNAESLCDEPNKTHFQMLMECKCNGNSVITSNPKLMNRGSCKMCFKLNIYLFFHNFKRLLPLLFRQRSSALSRLSSLYEVKLATGSIYYHPCSSQFKRGINSVATRLN